LILKQVAGRVKTAKTLGGNSDRLSELGTAEPRAATIAASVGSARLH
jgi:hypothetical protein